MTHAVSWWWSTLCAVAALNVTLWLASCVAMLRRRAVAPQWYAARRWQWLLCGVYVAGCAYRSVFLVYDVPRLCVVDSFFSSVIIGRSVATLAELCFVAQWSLILRESARTTGSRVGRGVAFVLVPLIAVAETCSWYSVLSTSNLGHVAEESIWAFAVVLLIVSVAVILPQSTSSRRPLLLAWCAVGVAYVVFMFRVDVPLYWARWVADETAGRPYLSLARGAFDVAHRRVVSLRWDDWKHEVAWMSLYFSVAVWISLSLLHAPLPTAGSRATRRIAGRELHTAC